MQYVYAAEPYCPMTVKPATGVSSPFAASEVGVNLKDGYNGDLTSREAGAIGGRMVQKMINSYKMQ